jgi:hypothetical protein
MKYFIPLFLLLLSCSVSKNPTTPSVKYDSDLYDENGQLYYQKVFEFENKKDLFVESKQWFSETFKSGKAVLDFADEKKGILIGKGSSTQKIVYKQYLSNNTLFFTVNIESKENKARVTIKDMYFKQNSYPFQEQSVDYWIKNCKGCGRVIVDQYYTNLYLNSVGVFESYEKFIKREVDDF